VSLAIPRVTENALEVPSNATRLETSVEVFVVNSPQNMRISALGSHVFTSSGATYFFGDNAPHATLASVLVSAPFTTEFSGVTPNPGSNTASLEEVPPRVTRFW
jgi:hypothetical protein